MSQQQTFMDLLNATSLPASADGAVPCNSPDGQQTSLYGLEAAPAKPSAAQEKAAEPVTTETYGRYLQISSESASLNTSLVNKLKQRLDSAGSIEYTETWKKKLTPSGVAYWAHTASTPRTSVSACTGERVGWPTPQAADPIEGARTAPDSRQSCLGRDVPLAGWPTMTLDDAKNCASPSQFNRMSNGKPRGLNLNCMVTLTLGQMLSGGRVEMASTEGFQSNLRLNPFWSSHLMGYSVYWTVAGMKSYLKSKKR